MIKRILNFFIKIYRFFISPFLPPACRFQPTCSLYASEALEVHGAIRGSLLATWRILRCQPLSAGGYDPVPEKKLLPLEELQKKEGLL